MGLLMSIANKKNRRKKRIVVDARMINDSGIGTYLKNVIPYLIPKYDLVFLGTPKDFT